MNITKFLKKEKGKERKSERITEIKEEGINKGKIKEKKKGGREKEEEEGRKENGKKKNKPAIKARRHCHHFYAT